MKHYAGQDEKGNFQYKQVELFSDEWKSLVLNKKRYQGYFEIIECQTYGTECPSQWNAKLSDGRFLYIRFRDGCLSVRVGKTEDEAIMGEELLGYFQDAIGGGEMSFDELKCILCKKFVFNCEEIPLKCA